MPSEDNWEFRRNDYSAAMNQSGKATLEEGIARGAPRTWYSQIPTATSLLCLNSDSQWRIDFAYATVGKAISCIEIMDEGDTPLSAAMQSVRHGLMFAYSRLHASEIGYTADKALLMKSNKLHLRVLAHILRYDLSCSSVVLNELEIRLNDGLVILSKDHELPPCDFHFWSFPPEFGSACSEEAMRNALEAIGPVEIMRRSKDVLNVYGGPDRLDQDWEPNPWEDWSSVGERDMRERRRRSRATLKAKAALAAVRGDRTTKELASQFGVHPMQIEHWKRQLIEGATELFSEDRRRQEDEQTAAIFELHDRIRHLYRETELLKKQIPGLD
jgi:transposase-like protein